MNRQFLSVGIVPYLIEDDTEEKLISSNSNKNHIYFLMIQRKDTIGFTEFIRGKYSTENTQQIQNLIDMMTIDEKNSLLEKSFHDLWHSMWYEKYYTNQAEYLKSKCKYDAIMENNTIRQCIQNSKTRYIEPEWGFPKGRKNRAENNMECAIREMKEETNIDSKDYNIIKNVKTKEEIYEGANNVRYIHKYYLCKLKRTCMNSIFSCILTTSQKKEVKNIGLFHYEECMNLIREYDTQKKKLLTDYYRLISSSIQFKILSQFYTKHGGFTNKFFNENHTFP
jgi:8-oxo-dGTP pyrophosphatase MutT (NUDIX family)